MSNGLYPTNPNSHSIDTLVERIGARNSDRDLRARACTDLQQFVLNLRDYRNFGKDPFGVLYQLQDVIFSRIPLESKKGVAKCIGYIGYVMQFKAVDYIRWVIKGHEQAPNQDTKGLFLIALTTTLEVDKRDRRLDAKCIEVLVQECMKALEAAESSWVVLPLLDVLLIIANNYEMQFLPHFNDVVDILAGWLVDPQQSENVFMKCEATLAKLDMFWMSKLSYSFEMMYQLLEDAEMFLQDVNDIKSNTSKGEHLMKAALLLRALRAILMSVAGKLVPSPSNDVVPFLDNTKSRLGSILETVESVGHVNCGEVAVRAVSCLGALATAPSLSPQFVGELLTYASRVFTKFTDHEQAISQALALVRQVTQDCPPEWILAHIERLVGEDGILKPLRLHHSQQTSMECLQTYRTLLQPKVLANAKLTYQYVVEELLGCIKFLGGGEWVRSIDVNIAKEIDEENGECVALFLLSALSVHVDAKNTLISMWGLQPNLFTLLTSTIPVSSRWLSAYPSLQYAILRTLSLHWEKHSFFMASSDLLPSIESTFTTSLHSAHYLTIIAKSLSELLSDPYLSVETRLLTLGILYKLQSGLVVTNNVVVFSSPVFCDLIISLLNQPETNLWRVKRAQSICVKYALEKCCAGLSQPQWKRVVVGCVLSVINGGGVEYMHGVHKADLMAVLQVHDVTERTAIVPLHNTKPQCNLDAQHLRLLAQYLLGGETIQIIEKDSEPLCLASLALINAEAVEDVSHATDSPGVLWNRVVWLCACYCVSNRLKTSFGKPLETFLVFENALRELATETHVGKGAKESRAGHEWFRVHMLLHLVDCLDKAMMNAYDGTAYALPAVSKPARTFFRTNRGTCVEWLNRIRLICMTVALRNGNHALVLRLAAHAFHNADLNKIANIEHMVVLTAKAMYNVGCPEGILGLYVHLKSQLGVRYTWLKPVADMAAQRYETALVALENILTQANSTNVKFVRECILECHAKLYKCTHMVEWIDSLTQENNTLNETRVNCGREMASFESMSPCKSNGQLLSVGWGWEDQVTSLEARLAVILSHSLPETSQDDVKRVKQVGEEMGELSALDAGIVWPHSLDVDVQVLHRVSQCATQALQSQAFQPPPLVCRVPCVPQHTALQWAWWNRQLAQLRPGACSIGQDDNLTVSRISRKYKNYRASEEYLLRHLQYGSSQPQSDSNLFTICFHKASSRKPQDLWSWLPVAYHASKLLCAKDEKVQGFGLLCDAVVRVLDSGLGDPIVHSDKKPFLEAVNRRITGVLKEPTGREDLAKAVLRLGDLMNEDSGMGDILLTNQSSQFIRLVDERLSVAETYMGALDEGSVVGVLLTLAAHLAPNLAKAQRALADWAYKAGKKAVEGSTNSEKVLLTGDELKMIVSSLSENAAEGEKEAVIGLLSSLKCEDNPVQTTSDMMSQLIIVSPQLQYVDTLVDIWDRANKRLFLFYDAAASAYFSYLKSIPHNEIACVTATLRLLRLLVKHVHHLSPVLQEQFMVTSPKPWQTILLQVFARLNHPSAVVRETLCRLLERMCDESPHLIVYPAVIGSSMAVPDANSGTMAECCSRIVGQLDESLVSDVRMFVGELQRVSLLVEEKWLSVLSHLHGDMKKRLEQIQVETERTNAVQHLDDVTKKRIINQKIAVYTDLVYATLRDLIQKTVDSSDTRNDAQFLGQFGDLITNAVNRAEDNSLSPGEKWAPFHQLLTMLTNRSTKRASLTLRLDDMSPTLACLQGSHVPLPGYDPSVTPPTIQSVVQSLIILPTKTRPKKLAFIASDGKRYTFLLKGLEDLHLDERIMQWLTVCNMMLANKHNTQHLYSARHYSVTPLGMRSGLIQWVQGATPMYSIYRKWQIRQNTTKSLRPSEMFYTKLGPQLEKLGMKKMDDRKLWPQQVLIDVIKQLIDETPNDLISKELWCASDTAKGWWKLTCTFARSTAVMSMIGYILGLGDRHLDNLLVDLSSGEIVHIDYNICFEKGSQLRVSETVPFRMTPNMQTALGPTQVEGVFRHSCEHVTRVLRGGRETLATLLEAFVYDPLVDWATCTDSMVGAALPSPVLLTVYGSHKMADGNARARQLVWQLFEVRKEELCNEWTNNKESLKSNVESMLSQLHDLAMFQESLDLVASNTDCPQQETPLHTAAKALLLDISTRAHVMREDVVSHHKYMLDMRQLLKMLSKIDPECVGVSDYMVMYRDFGEQLSSCLRLVELKEATLVHMKLALTACHTVLTCMDAVFDGLFALNATDRNPQTAVPQQEEKNVHALNVWKRVRLKLDGRERDANTRDSVIEQMAWNGSNPVGEVARVTQLCSSYIQKIQSNVGKIERLVSQIGTEEDNESNRGILHELQHDTNKLAKTTNEMLKSIEGEDSRQNKLQRERLTNDLMTVLTQVQKLQREAAAKEKASMQRARANSQLNPFDDTPTESLAPAALSHAKQLHIEQNVDLDQLHQRNEAIEELETNINDMNMIFKDLALMVHEQGEMVDSIEHNVENAVIHVEQGGQQLSSASRHASSLRKKRVFCIVLAIVLVIVLILVIYFAAKPN